MKYAFLLLLAAVPVFGQAIPVIHAPEPRVLIGAAGGGGFGNDSLGLAVGAEIPIGNRFEVEFGDTFSPIEFHPPYGGGRANAVSGGGLLWLSTRLGISGAGSLSQYEVTQISKGSFYASGGLVVRQMIWGMPSRLSFGYLTQLHNGIVNGTETDHVKGGYFGLTTRMGCKGAVCFRIGEQIIVGRVLTQGNPVCDGTFGDGSKVGFAPCPRLATGGAGGSASFSVEFPRRRGSEMEPF